MDRENTVVQPASVPQYLPFEMLKAPSPKNYSPARLSVLEALSEEKLG